MVDTLLEEGFDPEDVYDVTQRSLAVYLTLIQERVLGELATEDAVEAAADDAAYIVVNNVQYQRDGSPRTGDAIVNESASVEEPKIIAPTRFERNPVI